MRILHLTDTHLFGPGGVRHYDRIDTAAALAGVIDRLAPLGAVDLVAHTGDASEDGTVESYRRLHALLEPLAQRLGAQLAIAMGNHDVPARYAEVAGPGDHGGPWQDRVVDLPGGGRAVVLDTTVPGAGWGRLEPEQLEWLRAVLAQPAPGGRGTVLLLHHPPVAAATRMLRSLELAEPGDLAAVIADSDVRIVLAGHYHHAMGGTVGGVPVHVAPGITNVVDPVGASGDEEISLPLSGASLVELPDDDAAPRIATSVWPNAGDTLRDASRPVYRFGPQEVQAIIDAAGR
ncbi:metallophosphoesterase [Brachybacterium sp. EF45031]|uniref:metallophosphoesterase n=1 Tax=Brachybacterium sillae TaxID=2810536 RepID=UPI00217DE45F|nr:metallophosphoesterase [Brachybacterium sillae]MCS6711374.1 metallophosphoesterase [Brachybacterium sillae]